MCASFKHHQTSPKANIIFITGLTESFIKYSETIQYLYENGYNVLTYDHQSQGLSGRCKYIYIRYFCHCNIGNNEIF